VEILAEVLTLPGLPLEVLTWKWKKSEFCWFPLQSGELRITKPFLKSILKCCRQTMQTHRHTIWFLPQNHTE